MGGKMELGWSLPRREEYFRQAAQGATETYRERFQGDYQTFPLFSVPIGLPKYRLMNGRTVSLQSEWLADHPEEIADFFRRDPESDRAQEVQHELLTRLIKDKGLDKFFAEQSMRQKHPVILDSHGFIINGNRRVCCWRQLLEADRSNYGHYSHIRVVVLPPADDRAIDRLEAELQVTKDIREDYTWDTLANMLYERQQQHSYSETDLAEIYDMKPSEIRELLEMREYAIQYMVSRGKPSHWTMVRGKGTDYAFRKMLKARKQASSALDKRVIENVSFTLLDDREGLGRLYDAIPKLGEQLPKLKERLRSELKLSANAEMVADPTGFFGTDTSKSKDAALARAVELEESRDVLRAVAKDIIEEEQHLESEAKTASYVRKKLQKAHTEIQNALSGINETSSKEGVPEQIHAIESSLSGIQKWINGNA
jgi:hypothetical protein